MGSTTKALVCWLAVAPLAVAANLDAPYGNNWHQWRGPLAQGVAPRADPPIAWSETKNVKWKVELTGEGHATPIIWEDQVFVLSAEMLDRQVDSLAPPKMEPPGGYRTRRPVNFYRFLVHSFDRETGALRWQQVARETLPHEGRHTTNSYASGSPTTDGERLYVTFGSHGLYCYDLDGQLLWQRDLGDMITRLGWGEGTSPVIHGEHLIMNWDHEGESFIEVMEAGTGATRWRRARDEVTSWVTPRVVEHEGRTQLVVPATERIVSYDLRTGAEIWSCEGLTTNVIPCPVVHEDLVICMSGHRGNEAMAIRLGAQGQIRSDSDQIAWRLERDTPYVPSPLLYEGLLYFTKSNNAVLTCVDPASGDVLAGPTRLPQLQNIYASPLGAAGRVYYTSREGVTLVAKNQPRLEVLAVNRLEEGLDASPVAVDRELFLRGSRHLYCLASSD